MHGLDLKPRRNPQDGPDTRGAEPEGPVWSRDAPCCPPSAHALLVQSHPLTRHVSRKQRWLAVYAEPVCAPGTFQAPRAHGRCLGPWKAANVGKGAARPA